MTEKTIVVTGGGDTHKDTHVAAAVDATGRILATASFPATGTGYRELLAWLASHGPVARVGVEGTGSYGLGLARAMREAGVTVLEVSRPNRQTRRRQGKTDTLDAIAAARAVLAIDGVGPVKDLTGSVAAMRSLLVVLRSDRGHRTRLWNQLRDLVLTAPESLRGRLSGLAGEELVHACAKLRFTARDEVATRATCQAMKMLAGNAIRLSFQIDQIHTDLTELVDQTNPALRGAFGVGADTAATLLVTAGNNPERLTSAAAFAALCGATPIQASSGKIVRHRLNRGGDRHANSALWRISLVRLSSDPQTRDYAQRRRAEGKSTREIIRCLKTYIAREVFTLLTNPPTVIAGTDLRERRQAKGLTLANVAQAISATQKQISELERGTRPNNKLAHTYDAWLLSAA